VKAICNAYIKNRNLPVAFKRGRNMWRITPLAHLPNSKEKARVEFQASMNEL